MSKLKMVSKVMDAGNRQNTNNFAISCLTLNLITLFQREGDTGGEF